MGNAWFLGDMTEMMNNAVQVSHTTAPHFNHYHAYLASELAGMLPELTRGGKGMVSGYYCRHDESNHVEHAENLAEAFGLMRAHLLETGAVGLQDN